MRGRGVRRVEDGFEVVIGVEEREALGTLPTRLRAVLDGAGDEFGGEELRRRLFPRAYDEEELEADWQAMARPELEAQRSDMLATFSRTLEAGSLRGRRWRVQLTGEEAEAWLVVINDARLALASVVGITDESCWETGPDPGDPASLLLFYLGWLEEELVRALTGTLGDSSEPPGEGPNDPFL